MGSFEQGMGRGRGRERDSVVPSFQYISLDHLEYCLQEIWWSAIWRGVRQAAFKSSA